MHENQGNSVIFYAFYTEDGVGKTGLTVTIDVYEVTRAASATEIKSAQSATEIGDGLYRYLLASSDVDAAAEYAAVFKTTSTAVDQKQIPAMWVIDRAGSENLDTDIYTAKVWMFDDDSAGTPADRYVVAWFKNAVLVTSGITSPQLQVIKSADGTDQISATTMTEMGSTEMYRYDATSTARLSDGAAYMAKVTATIDGATRTDVTPVGRDS